MLGLEIAEVRVATRPRKVQRAVRGLSVRLCFLAIEINSWAKIELHPNYLFSKSEHILLLAEGGGLVSPFTPVDLIRSSHIGYCVHNAYFLLKANGAG